MEGSYQLSGKAEKKETSIPNFFKYITHDSIGGSAKFSGFLFL